MVRRNVGAVMPARSRVGLLVVAAMPWMWFAVRDAGPWMEVVAVTLPLLGVASIGGAALLATLGRSRLARTLLISTAGMALVACVIPRLPGSEPASRIDLTVASANLTGDNARSGDDVGDLLDLDPDILVLLEANVHAARRFDDVEGQLPNAILAPLRGKSRVAVFSRYAIELIEPPESVATPRIVAVRVDAPEPFTLIAAHLPRPWFSTSLSEATPKDRQARVVELADWLATLEGRVVLAGDLNSTDRGIGYRTLLETGNLVDAMRVEWASTTSTKWWPLLLRIDHVLVRGLCPVTSFNRALPGSDHRAIVAQLGACRG